MSVLSVLIIVLLTQALQFTVSSWNGSPEVLQCNIRSIRLWDTDVELSTVSFTVSSVLFFVLPMTFITVLYALIGLRLRRTDKLKRTMTVRSSNGEKKISSPEYRANSSSKVLKMLGKYVSRQSLSDKPPLDVYLKPETSNKK